MQYSDGSDCCVGLCVEGYKAWTAVLSAMVLAAGAGVLARRVVPTDYNDQVKSYVIPVEAVATRDMAQDAVVSIVPFLVKADVTRGEQLFKQCAVCHTPKKGEPHKIGPNLWGVVGAAIAHCADFAYSDGFNQKKGTMTWDYETLNTYLHKPRKCVPGTKMSFAGLVKEQDRADIIAYLRTLSDAPIALPEPCIH